MEKYFNADYVTALNKKKYLCHEICSKTNSNGVTFQLKLGELELKRMQASRKNLNEIQLNQSNDSI